MLAPHAACLLCSALLVPRAAPPALQAATQRLPNVPRHVAIIPDGNSRWATRHGRPRRDGHWAGVESLRGVIDACTAAPGIEVLTVYAFSVENWQRPSAESRWIFELVERVLATDAKRLLDRGVRLRFIGELDQLPDALRRTLESAAAMEPASGDESLLLCIALSYGGRQEIARVARHLAERAVAGTLLPSDLDEAAFAAALRGSELSAPSDPDLLVRSGGQQRLSNFLLFQAAYTELYVTDVLWPDFGTAEFEQALGEFARRKRTYGRRIT